MKQTRHFLFASFIYFSFFWGGGDAQAGGFSIVGVTVPETAILQGEPIPVRIELQNYPLGVSTVYFTRNGLLKYLELQLIDSQGKSLRMVSRFSGIENPSSGGILPLPNISEMYAVEPGNRLFLTYDLGEMFDIKNEGEYTIICMYHGSKIQEVKKSIKVLQLHELQNNHVKTRCSDWPGASIPTWFQEGARPVELDVLVGETRVKDEDRKTYVAVRNVQAKDIHLDRVIKQISLPVSEGVRVDTALLDANWSLWILLISKDKQYSLTRWSLVGQKVETVIDWQKEKPTIGTTIIHGMNVTRIVITGKDSKSVSVDFRVRP